MIRIFKTKVFNRWMKKVGITEKSLHLAIDEMLKGIIDANLCGGLIKKRVPLNNRGKSGGARLLIASNKEENWFFLYGFLKSERENISMEEVRIYQSLAGKYLRLTDIEIEHAIVNYELIEVFYGKKN